MKIVFEQVSDNQKAIIKVYETATKKYIVTRNGVYQAGFIQLDKALEKAESLL